MKGQIKRQLTTMQRHVSQEKGTEPPFAGEYWDCHDGGTYRCVCRDAPLFSSATKFDSRTGWPRFWEPVRKEAVRQETDQSFGIVRTEVTCTCFARAGRWLSEPEKQDI